MLGRTWAIARLTLLEALRRKVFLILPLFTLALVSSALFFPSVDLGGRLRLAESWSLRAAALFSSIVALFLAGFALPSDFEQKRIFLLVTKPVSKSLVFLGRLLGYALLLAVFLGVMGLVTTLFLRLTEAASGQGFPPLAAYPRLEASAFTPKGAEEISGGGATHSIRFDPAQALAWRFSALRPTDFDGDLRLEARFIFAADSDPFRTAGTVRFRLSGPGGSHDLVKAFNTNEERELRVPVRLLGSGGDLLVEALVEDPDGILAGQAGWMQLFLASASFEGAMLRGMLLLLLQSLIVLSVTLMASTFLTAPVSILLGILLQLVGTAHGYVREGIRDIDHSLSEIKPGEDRPRTPEELDPWILRSSSAISSAVLAVVPDFDHFDFSAWLLKDRLVSGRDLAAALGKAAPLILVFTGLGLLVMRSKDFG